MTPSSI